MNGADHYRKAERLLKQAEDQDMAWGAYTIAQAQVHATLAQVAAAIDTADLAPETTNEDWQAAMAGKPAPEPRRNPSFRDIAS